MWQVAFRADYEEVVLGAGIETVISWNYRTDMPVEVLMPPRDLSTFASETLRAVARRAGTVIERRRDSGAVA